MARLECQIREVSAAGVEPATMVEFSGSIDPDTLEIFEGTMDRLSEAGKNRIIYDFHKIKYINSTGMGMMVQFNDTLTEEGGGLVLMRIQPKVLLVVEMLGLQALFKIVANEAEALTALSGGEVGPATIEVKLAEEAKLETPEAITVEPSAIPAIEEHEAPVRVAQPTVSCPACYAALAAPVAGGYRCPRCRTALQVAADGSVEAYPEPVGPVSEMTLPADPEYLGVARGTVELAARKAGLDEAAATAAAEATEGCLRVLTVGALHGASEFERLHLFVRPLERKLSVRIYCGGKPLAGASAFDAFRGGVDRLDYSVSSQGNLVMLEKAI